MKNTILKTLTAAVILSAIFFLVELAKGLEPDLEVSLWGFLSNLMIASVLVFYISISSLRGMRLAISLFLIYYLIGFFNILIEAYIFNVTDRTITLNELFTGLVVTFIYSPILVLLFGKWEGSSEKINFESQNFVSWLWRIVVADLSYLFFYFLAGFILYAVYPPLMDFYEGKIPPFDLMINTQFFRAVVFILVALLILRTTRISILKKALFVGVLFTVLGGLAPLIPPNENMPGYIRLGHAFEVAFSNFIYGFVVSYLLAQKAKAPSVDVNAVPADDFF